MLVYNKSVVIKILKLVSQEFKYLVEILQKYRLFFYIRNDNNKLKKEETHA